LVNTPSSNINPRVNEGLTVDRQKMIVRAKQNGNNVRKISALHEKMPEHRGRYGLKVQLIR
jgi:hypothetical protein